MPLRTRFQDTSSYSLRTARTCKALVLLLRILTGQISPDSESTRGFAEWNAGCIATANIYRTNRSCVLGGIIELIVWRLKIVYLPSFWNCETTIGEIGFRNSKSTNGWWTHPQHFTHDIPWVFHLAWVVHVQQFTRWFRLCYLHLLFNFYITKQQYCISLLIV